MMNIRKVRVEDGEQLAALLKEVGWFELFNRQSLAAVIELVKPQLERCLADGSHSMFVAEAADGEIVGYVSAHWLPYLFLPGPEGFVSELFVRPAARGQGAGRQLLEKIEAEARTRGCSRLSLINFRHRESYERGFYVKVGWQERRDAANFTYPIR
jgi:GNAT superfamily N-acetyltransferase